MATTTDDEIRAAVRELISAEGQASCKALLALAERLGVPPARIGLACNELEIKIRGCQLGCFR